MPVLSNPAWERFAQAVSSGTSPSQAYKGKGNAAAEGPVFARNPRIRARIMELQAEVAAKIIEREGVTREWLIAELIRNYRHATGDDQHKNSPKRRPWSIPQALACLDKISKIQGYYWVRGQDDVVKNPNEGDISIQEWVIRSRKEWALKAQAKEKEKVN